MYNGYIGQYSQGNKKPSTLDTIYMSMGKNHLHCYQYSVIYGVLKELTDNKNRG